MSRPLLFGRIAATLAVLGVLGTAWFLDHRIPRATAIIQIHPFQIPLKRPTSYMENEFAKILSPQTIALAAREFGLPLSSDQTDPVVDSLTLSPVRGTDFIRITAKDDDPERAAQIANAIAHAYAKRRADSLNEEIRVALQDLEAKITLQEALVQQTQRNLEAPDEEPIQPKPEQNDLDQDRLIDRSFQKYQASLAEQRYEEARHLLLEIKHNQKTARAFLRNPRAPVTLHQFAD